ncbi:hypothetical protein ACFYXM_32280 [Streptomyces sp. NPDC002476]|uniref:hypothetical protein n=1 Tax=Streptomyces sp. NPDC002476 TaxID=3364648 RepID=UPI0036AEDD57
MSEAIVENETVEQPVVEGAAEVVSDDPLIDMLVDPACAEGLLPRLHQHRLHPHLLPQTHHIRTSKLPYPTAATRKEHSER